MRSSICRWAPEPMATIMMTAPTPMTIPSIVNSVLILFLRMLFPAIFIRVVDFMTHRPIREWRVPQHL